MAQPNQPADINTILMKLMQQIENNQTLQSQLINNNSTDLPHNMKINTPDVYNGEHTSTAVENQIYTLNNCFDLLALDFTSRTQANFCKSLREEFKPDNAETLARYQLRRLSQNGSITDYVAHFKNIMMYLPDMHVNDAKFQFIQGLQYDARLQVMLSEPTTLLDAYRLAECFEMAQQSVRGINKQDSFLASPNSMNQNTNSGVASMDLDTMNILKAQLHAIQQQLNHPKSYNRHFHNSNNNNRNIVCFYCNKPGHVKKYCRKRIAAVKKLYNK